MANRGRPKIVVTKDNRIEVIKMFLMGETYEEVSSHLGISTAKLSMFIRGGVFPSRKPILEFIARDYLAKLGNKVLSNPKVIGISTTTIISLLNKTEIKTCTGRNWNHNSLKRFLLKYGVKKTKKNSVITGSDLVSLLEKDFYSSFLVSEESLDVSLYLKTPPKFMVVPEVGETKEKKLSPFYQRVKKAVLDAIQDDCKTISEITQYLKELGIKNNSGNEISRWSMTLYLETLGIEVPLQKTVWGEEFLSALIHKIEQFPVEKRLLRSDLDSMLKDLTPEGMEIQNITSLRKEVSQLIKKHNHRSNNLSTIEKWYPLFESVCNETYRHKIPSYVEIAKELNISTMYAHRIGKQIGFDVSEPYYQSFILMMNTYEDQAENPTLAGLSEFLSNTYLKTPRGAEWTYGLARLAKINSLKYLKIGASP